LTLAFRANGELRALTTAEHVNKQVRDTDPLPPALRNEYTGKFGPLVEEGIADLQKAIQIRPDYDDAMAYLNLLYRRKADMVESADERAALLKQADDLVDKVKEIKQKRAEQPSKSAEPGPRISCSESVLSLGRPSRGRPFLLLRVLCELCVKRFSSRKDHV